MKPIGDFHVHTNYCPHGANDKMEDYIIAAIKNGLKYLTFTEHAPLPKNFTDPTPKKDSAMEWGDVYDYLNEASRLKQKYKDDIIIEVGFEVDYIEGYERETKSILDQIVSNADTCILSVHMLEAPNGEYVCIDYSEDEFKRIVDLFGSVDSVYQCYYQTVKGALLTDLGEKKPTRIGHLTLIEKFNKLFKPTEEYDELIDELLYIIKKSNLSLDANTAGFFKENCQMCYPSVPVMTKADDLGIPLIFGSDSHKASHIGRGSEQLPSVNLELPLIFKDR